MKDLHEPDDLIGVMIAIALVAVAALHIAITYLEGMNK